MAKANPAPWLPKKPTAPRPRRRRTVSPATFIANSRRVSSEQKAIWHNVTGAGRAGTIRKFFDLNAADQQALRDGLEKTVALRVSAAQR